MKVEKIKTRANHAKSRRRKGNILSGLATLRAKVFILLPRRYQKLILSK
ncbi:MAG: hypothetical protein HND52_12570 [Ignavibacteriae bacterium]|nr:hypothetical protein [Ignavibacteriota bacterium]